jgi:hypothetical protein
MNYTLKLLAAGILLVALSSCNDLLDNPQPSTAISQEQALNSPGGVEAIRTSMYSRLHSFSYATSLLLAPSSLADDLFIRAGATRFVGQNENSEGVHVESWGTAYDLINDANIIIGAIPEGVLDDAVLQQYQGEAYFFRAFAYHHMARAYAYEPGVTPTTGDGAGWDAGVILRTSPTLSEADAVFLPRSTVQQTYDLIISDLEESIRLLQNGDVGTPDFVSLAAAQALMARVQLYARNYEAANDFAADAIANASSLDPVIDLASTDEVATMFDETIGLNPEGIFTIRVDPNTESLGTNASPAAYTSIQWGAQIPTQDLIDLYGEDDARLAWYGPCINDITGVPFANCIATSDFIDGGNSTLEIQKYEAELGQFADFYTHFRISEMLLIQAEARVNDPSLGDPLAPINALRAARGLDALTSVTVDDVLEERRRELVAEGHRFFDLKRLGRTIRKAPETLGTNVQDVPFNDFRVLNNIPDGAVSLSEANAEEGNVLVQNPGH